uniref:EH domain-containing protein n=1 Tax=Sinocyclocheilus grahami TaxID=75366 RepID=A0A672RXA2_SINGR
MNGPFGHGYGEGAGEGIDEVEWVVARDKPMYDEIFYTLSPVNGKVTGANAKKEMVKSKLPNTVLGKIWKLADIDNDGMLDDEEFALANHLIKVKLEGHELPSELPVAAELLMAGRLARMDLKITHLNSFDLCLSFLV